MRPSYSKTNKKIKCTIKRKTPLRANSRKTKYDLDNINKVLHIHKSKLAQGKTLWKVVTKDSCEVYKNRRSRQNGTQNREDSKSNQKDTTSDECTCSQKQCDDSSKSSFSSESASETSCSCLNDSDN